MDKIPMKSVRSLSPTLGLCLTTLPTSRNLRSGWEKCAASGFVYFDLHGDATPLLMRTINAKERRLRRHLSDKLILIEPADPIVSVGLNPRVSHSQSAADLCSISNRALFRSTPQR
jgi:hypothetical protein